MDAGERLARVYEALRETEPPEGVKLLCRLHPAPDAPAPMRNGEAYPDTTGDKPGPESLDWLIVQADEEGADREASLYLEADRTRTSLCPSPSKSEKQAAPFEYDLSDGYQFGPHGHRAEGPEEFAQEVIHTLESHLEDIKRAEEWGES